MIFFDKYLNRYCGYDYYYELQVNYQISSQNKCINMGNGPQNKEHAQKYMHIQH